MGLGHLALQDVRIAVVPRADRGVFLFKSIIVRCNYSADKYGWCGADNAGSGRF